MGMNRLVLLVIVSAGLVRPGLAADPASVDDLFQLDAKPKAAANPKPTEPTTPAASPAPKVEETQLPMPHGFLQSELAYTWPSQGHWSKFRNLLEVGSKGGLWGGAKWVGNVRFTYDPSYDWSDYYPSDVRDDQRRQFEIRETYLDLSAGDFDFRIGRQHIVWGEMVGLFFADVVSAKDLRQFVLPDFDLLRIPQWAIRSEYFHGDFHGEAIWLPVTTYDNIGKVGSEFYPFNPTNVPGFDTVIQNDKAPPQTMGNSAFGLRGSYLKNGWDTSAFYFSTLDLTPAFRRDVILGSSPVIQYTPEHKRIHQFGMTLAKDINSWAVFKAEAIYTLDRPYSTLTPTRQNGLVNQNALDYVAGVDMTAEDSTRVNLQFFQRIFTNRDPGIFPDQVESGVTALLSTRALHPKLEPEILYVYSLSQEDWMLQSKLTWEFATNWRWVTGVDAFGGPQRGLFGQYGKKDRGYMELRYSF